MKESGARIAQRLLTRPAGATMDELIAATGGPQYNVLRRLEARGYKLRKVREGRITRYFATPPATPSVELVVNPKGQVTLPKEVREHLGVRSGGSVRFSLQEDGRAFVGPPKKTLQDLFTALGKPKQRFTLEQIDEGIGKAIAKRFHDAVRRDG
jgi:AbrB family looped-hinge helix DNA binding protein